MQNIINNGLAKELKDCKKALAVTLISYSDELSTLRTRVTELEAEIENWTKADSKAVADLRNALTISEANAERLANFIRYAMQVGALRGKRLGPKALEVLDEHEAVNGWRDE